NSMVCFDAAPADCQPEPKPGSVLIALLEGQEHSVGAARLQTTTMILDINQDPIRDCMGVHRDFRAVRRELEGILQQVSDGRKKHVAVDIDRKTLVDSGYCEFTLTGTRFERCGDPDLIHEI